MTAVGSSYLGTISPNAPKEDDCLDGNIKTLCIKSCTDGIIASITTKTQYTHYLL